MAITTFGNSAATQQTLRDRLVARLDVARADYAKWRVYRRTYNELSALSNRDLADLGLSRGEIHNIASQAAYNG